MVVRFFEKKDNVFAEQKFIYDYAVAKGALTGAQELIIGLWNFATNIPNLGKMIRTMWELLVAIYNNPELIQKMGSKMIEDFQKQQEKDNPFEKDTVDYVTFYSGWLIGYGALQIAVIIFGDKGVSKVSKVAKSSSKLNKAVGSLKNKASGGKLPDRSVLNRRIRPCSTTSSQVSANTRGDCVDIDTKAMRNIKEKVEKVPKLEEFLYKLRKIRRRYGGRKNSANLFDDIKNKNIGNIKGDLGEYQWAIQLQDKLPDNYIDDFSQLSKPPIVKKLETTPNGTAKLLPGDSRIVIGENTMVKGLNLEFDAILVGRVPLDRPDGGKLKIYNISEVKTKTSPENPEKITFQTGKKLNEIRTKVNDKGDALTENDLYAGIPMKTFKNVIDEQSSESIIRNVVPDGTAGSYKYKLKHSEKVYKSMAEEIKKDIDLLDSYTQFP